MEQWFQVDLLKTTNVTAVASQGDILDGNWVTEYALNYSCDGVKWFSYTYQGALVVSHIYEENLRYGLIERLLSEC